MGGASIRLFTWSIVKALKIISFASRLRGMLFEIAKRWYDAMIVFLHGYTRHPTRPAMKVTYTLGELGSEMEIFNCMREIILIRYGMDDEYENQDTSLLGRPQSELYQSINQCLLTMNLTKHQHTNLVYVT